MTFSLLAFDPDAHRLGIASASHYPGVGSVVTWAEAGTGVVATQAFAEPVYGARGLALIRAGMTADKALASLLADDDTPEIRQVAIVDALGTMAAHTGRRCMPAVSAATAAHAIALGNTLDGEVVAAAMVEGYERADGDMTHRLVAALRAGDGAGGDIRGRQSAALRVVDARPSEAPWTGDVRDIRVDDHTDPIAELARLTELHDVYDGVTRAVFDPTGAVIGPRDGSVDATTGTEAAAQLALADRALGANPEAGFWAAVAYARIGEIDLAGRLLDRAARRNGRLFILFRRLVDIGVLTHSEAEAAIDSRPATGIGS